jgi:hypothetical protein
LHCRVYLVAKENVSFILAAATQIRRNSIGQERKRWRPPKNRNRLFFSVELTVSSRLARTYQDPGVWLPEIMSLPDPWMGERRREEVGAKEHLDPLHAEARVFFEITKRNLV